MKKAILIASFAAVLGLPLAAQTQQSGGAAGVIVGHYATAGGGFSTGALPAAELERIVLAGIRAPSANNRQPWHFTVVQNLALAKKLIPQSVEGNVVIVVSAADNGKPDQRMVFDCALAAESIYLAAQALGYGSRIYTGPIDGVNKNLKGELGLSDAYTAVALIRVGKIPPKTDAVSAASSRKAADSVVTYK